LRVATIDIGTNTVLLLVAEKGEGGGIVPLVERAEITRLGQGVDRTRTFSKDAIERTLACLAVYAAEIRRFGADAVDVVGTSALRDAGRAGAEFVERAAQLLGAPPRVISGDEEAALTFAGGLEGLGLEGEVAAFDVGGGSTELIAGRTENGVPRVEARKSIDVGSVRLFERHVEHDPPTTGELALVRSFVLGQLVGIPPPPRGGPLVGMAGTVTTLAAVARAIDPYDSTRIHGMRLDANEIEQTARRLAGITLVERKLVPGLEPQRADVIPVGAVIVQAILAWAGASDLIVSDRGVRWGAALALFARLEGRQ
jgi:exopolyphosphatase/guanosine-5'-triphosphate,3'-diphosphate pyrophosphatase